MKSKRARRIGCLVASLMVLGLVVTACTPDAAQLIISPQLGSQLTALESGNEIVAAAAVEAPKLSELAPEQIVAGLPDDVAAALDAADPANGEQISLARGCIGCHALDPNVTMTGPTWYHVGDTAVSRVPGESPALYLYHSIVNPGSFVAPNYPNNIMPANYGEQLSVQELADLIDYLLQQNAANAS
ncbi:c-type cytochrome [Caldilinea sp.]|uniref:c-type cytochrome n=1 Tax=Caldilinea sp. TaxID=2293560 RepID=UPI0031CCC34E